MDQVLNDVLAKLDGLVDSAEVYAQREQSTDVDILNDQINHAKEENVLGIGIRILKDQRQGFAYTTDLKRIDETINQAISNSKLNRQDENIAFREDNDNKYKSIDGLYDKSLEDIQLEEAIDYSQALIDYVNESECQPTSGGFSTGIGSTYIANSNGVYVSEESSISSASISVNVEDNDVVSSAYYYDVSHTKELDLELIANNAIDLALRSRNAKPTTTRDTRVVLNHTAAVSLLVTYLSALNSENKQRGRSRFMNSQGEVVASEDLTIMDDGTLKGAIRSSVCDDEATPTTNTTLINDGVLDSFIYDIYRANNDEADVQTTANGLRSGYDSVPSVGFTNVVLDFKDKMSIEDINEGIFVDSVMGAHTANPISGDFSVEGLNAFEIKDGQITNPIKKIMLSGNIFDIMMNVSAIDGEIRQLGPCITPQLLVDNLRVIG
ncbi:MAG: TldD/PmbA family protein [Methanosphaera sp.]|nr:TldD/PmbA family protein [Methanosphaera sp.]